MTHAAELLVENLKLLELLPGQRSVLDLACGSGRNGLFLSKHGIPVVFADRDKEKIQSVADALECEGLSGEVWCVDLEETHIDPLANKRFEACLVFNYLYRPRIASIKDSVVTGGLIYYETFTLDNRKFGRPNNPEFLLRPNELRMIFQDWEVLHYFEGEIGNPNRAIANIIARKH